MIEQNWRHIELWLENNAPKVLKNLNIGAGNREIQFVEEELGVQLPVPIKDSYKIHNGQLHDRYNLMGKWTFLSLDSAMKDWHIMKKLYEDGIFGEIDTECSGQVKNNWWNLKWLPLFGDGLGNFLCVDLDPALQGVVGQIIYVDSEDPLREKTFDSYQKLIDSYIEDLEKGRYRVINDKLKKI